MQALRDFEDQPVDRRFGRLEIPVGDLLLVYRFPALIDRFSSPRLLRFEQLALPLAFGSLLFVAACVSPQRPN